MHENHLYPLSISEYGKLRKCLTKSDFLVCLNGLAEPIYDPPNVEMEIIDGAAFVNMNPPTTSNAYGEYCDMELKAKVLRIADGLQQVDILFGTYEQNTIKSDTRDSRGKGIRFSVWQDTPVYKNFQDFMRCDKNKTEIFQMISNSLSKINCPTQIVTTKLSVMDTINLQPCNQEEAHSRIFLYLINASKRGVKRVLVATVDTDVVVVLIYHLFFFKFEVLWVEMGVGQHLRWLPIHTYAQLLTNEVCQGLPFLYAVTDCDTVSMFLGHGKKTAWKVRKSFPEKRSTFARFQ